MSKQKYTEAKAQANTRWENKQFRTLVRFPAELETEIRAAAGDSLNGFIVQAVREKLERMTGDRSQGESTPF